MLKCDYDLCIYNEQNKCILDEIEISAAGCCARCMVPDFPEKMLQLYKKKLLRKFNTIYAGWDKNKE